jgi:hypothetical protein
MSIGKLSNEDPHEISTLGDAFPLSVPYNQNGWSDKEVETVLLRPSVDFRHEIWSKFNERVSSQPQEQLPLERFSTKMDFSENNNLNVQS